MSLPRNLPAILRGAGLKVVEHDGWQHRGRPASTGGFDPVGILCHHTATGRSTPDAAVIRLLTHGRSDLPGPLCQLGLDRQGRVHIIAAGRANHAGRAKTSGTVAAGDGNRLYIGVEAFNNGVGEPWPKAQYDAYVLLAATLCRDVTGNSSATVRGHKETSTSGKVDPTFDMGDFRRRVDATIRNRPALLEDDMPDPKDLWSHPIENPVDGQQRSAAEWEWRTFNSVRRIERLIARGPAADEIAAKVAAKVGNGASAKDIAAELIRQLDTE